MFCAIFGLLITIPFIDVVGDQQFSNVAAAMEVVVLFEMAIVAVNVPWCFLKKARKAPESTLTSVTIPPQSFPIKLPVGPPDDGDENRALVKNEALQKHSSNSHYKKVVKFFPQISLL